MRPIATLLIAIVILLEGCAPSRSAPATEQGSTAVRLRKPDVPYEPSSPRVVAAMLQLAEVSRNDVVYDLGSGDGRIPIAAARGYGARSVGIELDPKLVALSRKNALEAGVADKVTIRNEDLFEADFSEATVVTLFLWPEVNLKLRPKLLAVLRPGTRIVSHWHDMGDWVPEKTVRIGSSRLYLWRIPAAQAKSSQ